MRIRCLAVIAVVGALFVPALVAQDFPDVTDVVLGTVNSVTAFWQTNAYGDRIIISRLEVRVEQRIRGNAPDVIVTEVNGGTADGVTLGTNDVIPSAGEQVYFFLGSTATPGTYDVHGRGRGILRSGGNGFTPIGHVWGTSRVSYLVNPDNIYVTPDQALTAVQFAANDWNSQGGANIQLVYAGLTNGGSLTLDHVNNVFFRNDASGYIAETYWWWDGTGHLVDADIVFHENYAHFVHATGCAGGYYVENTGTHEFGHVLGLNHSADASATMWATEDACETSKETLAPDDIAGIQSLYPTGGTPPPPPPPPGCRPRGKSGQCK